LSGSRERFNRLVVKFGGSSLSDGPSVSRAVDAVLDKARKGFQIAVVVSAMGKTTDHLIETAKKACGGTIKDEELDDIMALGERTSARIFAAALKTRGQRSCYLDPVDPDWPIITDGSFTNANPILPLCEGLIRAHIQPLLEEGNVVVIPGFIGKTGNGTVTTMGRGGSDITAFVLAHGLSADQVILVTDVDGIMTADPKVVGKPRILKEISMDMLVGLADSGTKFIHKKALRYKNPSIEIKVINNTYGSLAVDGTTIKGSFPNNIVVEEHPDPAMAVTIVGKAIAESPQTIQQVFQELKKADIALLGMSLNHNSLILYMPTKKKEEILEPLHSIVVSNERTIALAVRENLAFIKVKGVGLEETPGIISDITKSLHSSGINIYGIFTITSSVLIFVDLKDKDRTIRLIEENIRTNTG